jgi:hypothetical protein
MENLNHTKKISKSMDKSWEFNQPPMMDESSAIPTTSLLKFQVYNSSGFK